MAHLEILEGVNGDKTVSLEDEVVLGRNPDNAVCLPDYRISRQHARMRRQGPTFVIEDLNSTNGVILQGSRIPPATPCPVHDGDEIRIGSARLVFHADLPHPSPAHATTGLHADTGAPAPCPHEVDLTGNFGPLTLTMLTDKAAQPRVALALEASTTLPEVDAEEGQSGKGLQDAVKRLQAICQVSTALIAIVDRDKLLQKLLDCLFDIFPAAERAFIMLRDHERGKLIPVVAKTRHAASGQRQEVAIAQTIVNDVMTHKRAILSLDTLDDERCHEQASVINLAMRSSTMCAPLLVGEEILGLLQVDTRPARRSFTPQDLHILTGISAQAAIAVKNMQLYEAVEAKTARRTSLERYFSPGLVEMLMSGDLPTALGGNAYQGTVLFSDIIGFTAMSESMSPAEVVTRLNRYFTVMQKVIYANDGNVDKFSGDGIMAFWGVPRTSPHDERDAVLTALCMQAQLWSFNLALESEGQRPIHMGIGLNSGAFVAGNIGSEDKIEFTLIGDTVNLAARLEERAGRSQVFVSEATWSPIKHLVCAVQLPPIRLKGKSKPTTIYSIRALQDGDRGALALPCHLFDGAGNGIGRGMLTERRRGGSKLQMLLCTDIRLNAGDLLTVRLAMSEYHQPLCFTASVASCAAASHAGGAVFTRAMLTAIRAEAVDDFLTSGSCLVTDYTWADLIRA